MEVVGINSKQTDEQTIEVLKDLLAKAENGDLRSIIFIDQYRDGKCGMGWAGTPNLQMIGKIEELKFDFFSQTYFPTEQE